ncbi:MAG TPA: type I phosphomannose isomerase catalytic subunit [Pirellulales bacterium]
MSSLGPLRFVPMFRRYVWGGRKLGTFLGKPIGEGEDYAESWEVVDHGEDQSIVAAGPSAGAPLGQLVRERGGDLFGRHAPLPQFPLLFKYLDAQRDLSVQVHPDDARAALLSPPDFGKTEAWVIVAAEPESWIYAGLKRGFDRAALAREVSQGASELSLHRFHPQVGDCVFIPAGAVHAIGSGLVVAEIQQSSDTTWRLHDWNRLDASGRPRPLHVEAALEAIDYSLGPLSPARPAPTERPHVSRLVECDKFVLDRWTFNSSDFIDDDNRFHILSVLAGEVAISGDPTGRALSAGETALLPAVRDATELIPRQGAIMLDAYLP